MAPNLEMRLYSGYPLYLKQPAGNPDTGTSKTFQPVPVVLNPAIPANRDNDHACNPDGGRPGDPYCLAITASGIRSFSPVESHP